MTSARFLAEDARVTDEQLDPMVFESNLPMPVKIILAGGLARPSTLHERFPRRLDRFDTIPLPIRLALLMKLAEAAEPGARWPSSPLQRMGAGGDEASRLLSLYCRAAAFGDGPGATELQEAADADATKNGLASILASALDGDVEARSDALKKAARWLDENRPATIEAGGIRPGPEMSEGDPPR
ncbi:MAG: hypothetical protein U0800_04640 [Isosphaeraceae bacterium]